MTTFGFEHRITPLAPSTGHHEVPSEIDIFICKSISTIAVCYELTELNVNVHVIKSMGILPVEKHVELR